MARGQSLYDWCMENGEWGQQLLYEFGDGHNSQQFIDETGNYIKVTDVSKGTARKKVKWKCIINDEHVWEASIFDRTRGDIKKRTGCPYCKNKKVSDKNSIKSWCENNGEWGKRLLNEWVGIDEQGKRINIDSISYGSHKLVQWKCINNHTWYEIPWNRCVRRFGCPKCYSEVRGEIHSKAMLKEGKNDLLTWCNNTEFGKQIINEWVGIDEQGNSVEISKITYGSKSKVWWKCCEGHRWIAQIISRTSSNSGCPYCHSNNRSELSSKAQLKVGVNDLNTWCDNNGVWGQRLTNEWVGLDENGREIDIFQTTYASPKKVQWRCKNEHNWIALVSNRTTLKSGCPYCNSYSTSFPEQFIYYSLKQIYSNTINRGKYQGYEYDITIPELKLCIEYSGIQWHKDKLGRDDEKKQLCQKHEVRFLQIYAHHGEIKDIEENVVDDSYTKEQIIYEVNSKKSLHIEQLKQIVKFILEQYAPEHTIAEINFIQAESDSYAIMQGNT